MSSISREMVLAWIGTAADTDLNEVIQALIRRYGDVFPDWEVFFYSVKVKDLKLRRKQIKELKKRLNQYL